MANLTENAIKKVVRNLLTRDADYRVAIIAALNAQFMDFAIDFFKKIVNAKMEKRAIDADWYKAVFINKPEDKRDIATNAGMNIKTIDNIHGTTRREVVVSAAGTNYDALKKMIEDLIAESGGVDITIAIAFGDVSINLNINESLVVINALAVKRAAMRGGLWSSVGKKTEGKLMRTLCYLFSVPPENYKGGDITPDENATFARETDFYLIGEKEYKCEVKLMGKGNPESADSVIAHESDVFVADTMSDTNIKQMDSLGVQWVHLRDEGGYLRFGTVLENLGIPHQPYGGELKKDIDAAIEKAFS